MNFSEYSVDLAMKVLIKINLPNASKEGQSDLLVDISSLFKLIVKQTRPGTEHPTPLTLASKSRLVCPLYATRRRGTPGLRGTFITYTSCLVRGRILCCFVCDSDLMLMQLLYIHCPSPDCTKRSSGNIWSNLGTITFGTIDAALFCHLSVSFLLPANSVPFISEQKGFLFWN